MASEKNPIFLSYQWANQSDVKTLQQFLKHRGFDAWMDINQLAGGTTLTEKIAEAILNADIFVCCITKKIH